MTTHQERLHDRVDLSIEGGVATVTLDRPDKRNGLDLAMFRGVRDAGEAIKKNKAVRAVVLQGNGKAFCAGLDFQAFMASPDVAPKLLDRQGDTNLAQAVGWVWAEVEVPVIAAVQGSCIGGGLQIALGADLRYLAPDAVLSVMEIKYGLIPDMGASKTLLRHVRLDVAKELTFTGRKVGAEEAVALGLGTKVCDDPRAAAQETARAIAARSPHAIRAGKKLYGESLELGVRAAFELETVLQVKLLGSANQMEAVMASMQRRDAVFADPE